METTLSINLITSNPKIRNGRPIIAGTQVCVSDVATALVYHGQDADGIAQWFDLSLAQVHAALAYYYQHLAKIDAEINELTERGEAQKSRAANK